MDKKILHFVGEAHGSYFNWVKADITNANYIGRRIAEIYPKIREINIWGCDVDSNFVYNIQKSLDKNLGLDKSLVHSPIVRMIKKQERNQDVGVGGHEVILAG